MVVLAALAACCYGCSAPPANGGNNLQLQVASPKVSLSRRETISVAATMVLLLRQPSTTSAATLEQQQKNEGYVVSPSGLAFCDVQLGTGAPLAKGSLIKAHYSGKLENGTVFDSSYKRGRPLTFRVGVGEVIKGWDQGILGTDGVPPMLPGGKRKLRIPPELGYGDRGAGCRKGSCVIPPNSVLLFDVELLGKA